MQAVSPADFDRANGRFHALFAPLTETHLFVTAVLHQASPGHLFVDDPTAPRSGLMLTVDGGFLAGAADDDAFNAALAADLAAVLQAAQRLNPAAPQLDIYLPDAAWEPALADIVGDWRWPPIVQPMRHYQLGTAVPNPPPIQSDAVIVPLDAARLHSTLPPTLQAAIAIGWGDVDAFWGRGFGFAALVDGEIAAWCLTNVVVAGACELSVETRPAYRRRGLATAVTAAATAHAQQHACTRIDWRCAADNTASMRIAERVGFERKRPFTAYTFYHDEARHYTELGKLYFFANLPAEAADALDLALELSEQPADYVYLLAARAEAKLGNGRDALNLLHAAVDAGFHDAALLASLPEFTPLRRRPAWQKLLNAIKSNRGTASL